MKSLIKVKIACLAGCFFAGIASARAQNTIVPGRSIGRIWLGVTRASVIKTVGRPQETTLRAGLRRDEWSSAAPVTTADGERTYTRVLYDAGRAIQIETNSPRFKTASGVSTLTPLKRLSEVYPNLRFSQYLYLDAGYNAYYYEQVSQGIAFSNSGNDLSWTLKDEPQRPAAAIFVHRPGTRVKVESGGERVSSSAVTAPIKLSYQRYESYFEAKTSVFQGANSYLMLPTQSNFDQTFGAAALMSKNSFLPGDTFRSKVVVAVIKRGNSFYNYTVQSLENKNGTLSVRYNAVASAPSSASFASPLILTVPKAAYRSIIFIENGKRVATVQTKPTAASTSIKVYLVALGDGGKRGRKFGCDDSLVAVTRTAITRTPLKWALEALLSTPARDDSNGGLENFWKGRGLRLKSVNLRKGVATVDIVGEVFVAGVCDLPRITEQIEATARQFASVKQVRVLVGGRPLAEAIA